MADWTTELQGVIATTWAAGTGLSSCPLYFNRTYPGKAYPYATFYLEANHDRVCQGTTRLVTFQVNIFSEDPTDAAVCTLKAASLAAITGATLTMASWSCTIKPQPASERVFLNDSEHWQATILFNLRIH